MVDSRFYTAAGPFSVAELAELSGATLGAGAAAEKLLIDVAPLQTAGPEHLSFLDNRLYLEAFVNSGAGACIVHPDLAARAPGGMAVLLSEGPYKAYALAASAFYPPAKPEPGIAKSAVVAAGVVLGDGCRVEPGAVIGEGVEVGARCWIGANAVIGAGVVLGDDTIVGACASLASCIVGNRVHIYPGARIGQEGFGFAPDPAGHARVPQVGRVIIHDDVEIGANTTIDRGAGPDTVIGRGCRIDNLVQIGHNVELGRGCIIVGQAGISGSTKLGDFVAVGGQGGIAGHLDLGAGARVAGQSGVMRDVAPGATVGGYPAVPIRDWHRQTIAIAKLLKRKTG